MENKRIAHPRLCAHRCDDFKAVSFVAVDRHPEAIPMVRCERRIDHRGPHKTEGLWWLDGSTCSSRECRGKCLG